MEIYIKNRTTGRIVKGTMKQLKTLGGNYARVQGPDPKRAAPPPPAAAPPPPKEEGVAEEAAAPSPPKAEMTREELLEAIKATGFNKKGMHLMGAESLRGLYATIQKGTP